MPSLAPPAAGRPGRVRPLAAPPRVCRLPASAARRAPSRRARRPRRRATRCWSSRAISRSRCTPRAWCWCRRERLRHAARGGAVDRVRARAAERRAPAAGARAAARRAARRAGVAARRAARQGRARARAPVGQRLWPIALDDEPLYLREDALTGFESGVDLRERPAPGRRRRRHPDGAAPRPGRRGRLGADEVAAIEIAEGRSTAVRAGACSAGSAASCRAALLPSEAPGGLRGFVAFAGEGMVLLDGR